MKEITSFDLNYLVIPRWLYKDRRLSRLQMELLGFIHTYSGRQFYFSNQKLAEMFSVSEKGISKALLRCKFFGYVEIKYKIKADGGKIRFINKQKPCPEGYRGISRNDTAVSDKDNKIKDNNNDNGTFKNVLAPIPLWIGEVTSHYFLSYKEKTGRNHPRLSESNSSRVKELISNCEWDLDVESWKIVIDKWFSEDRNTDWNINHFVSGKIVENRMYEEIY